MSRVPHNNSSAASYRPATKSEETTLNTYQLPTTDTMSTPIRKRVLPAALVLLALALAGCGDKNKEAKPGQALARVDGSEITVLQLNEELQRAGVPAPQQKDASKQLLQALIDRQLLDNAAEKEKLDRDPKVMQAVDRARALIVAQAYMAKKLGNPVQPSNSEVENYFNQHPEFFSNRKAFAMNELVIPSTDLTPDLRAAADTARSLEELAVWLDAHKVKYGRTQVTRSTSDLPPEISKKLLAMQKGQVFIVNQGDRALLVALTDVKDAPVSLEVAAPQIAQALATERNKDAAANEIKRLRDGAKIEVLNKDLALDPKATAANPAAAVQGSAPAAASTGTTPANPADKAALDRGVAGLK
jgi:EpsD family peptidyl-prolyl cis-trans isomerase